MRIFLEKRKVFMGQRNVFGTPDMDNIQGFATNFEGDAEAFVFLCITLITYSFYGFDTNSSRGMCIYVPSQLGSKWPFNPNQHGL